MTAVRTHSPTPRKMPLERWLTYLALGSVLVAAVTAVALTALARPVDDDFNLGLSTCRNGFHYVFRYYYLNLSGRWAEVLLETLFLSRVDLLHRYWMLLLGIHVTQWMALLVFWRLLWPEAGWGRLAAMATLTYGVFWCVAPNPGETYYWFTGGVAYSLSLSLAILMFGALIEGCLQPRGSLKRYLLLGTALALAPIVPAMHEVVGACLLLVCLLALGERTLSSATPPLSATPNSACRIPHSLQSRPATPPSSSFLPWLTFSSLVFVGFLACALAPGNANRAATFKNGHSLLITIKSLIKLTALYVMAWLSKPTLWGAALFLLTTPAPGTRPPEWLRRGATPWRWLFPAATLLLVALCLLIPSWVMGGANGRLLTMTQQILLLGGCATAVAWGAHLDWLRRWPAAKRLRLAGLGLLALSPWLMGNLHRAVRQGWSRAIPWSQELERQYRQARAAKATGQIDVEFMPVGVVRPDFFYSDGITPNPADWRNEGFANYFGLRSVWIRK